LCVKPGLNSLSNAVKEAKKNGITDIYSGEIYLLNGTHDEKREVVTIDYSVSIIGESREHCIVMGGLWMKGKKEDDVDVSNLTLRDSKFNGVDGSYNGASFHLDNVSVENSGYCGVSVWSTKRNSMKNCNVSHSIRSGLRVSEGGLMTIDGNGTTIHHNGTSGRSDCYGLKTVDSSSSIHLASSLTIETISKNNGGGGNHGGDGTIKTITSCATKNTETESTGETKVEV